MARQCACATYGLDTPFSPPAPHHHSSQIPTRMTASAAPRLSARPRTFSRPQPPCLAHAAGMLPPPELLPPPSPPPPQTTQTPPGATIGRTAGRRRRGIPSFGRGRSRGRAPGRLIFFRTARRRRRHWSGRRPGGARRQRRTWPRAATAAGQRRLGRWRWRYGAHREQTRQRGVFRRDWRWPGAGAGGALSAGAGPLAVSGGRSEEGPERPPLDGDAVRRTDF
jgi:hypothetical protein